jgi:thiol-disulfide isomerase/thioredoxin
MFRHQSLLACLALGVCLMTTSPNTRGHGLDRPLPPFTRSDAASWLNSPPLTVDQLRGQVVLLDVWTFGCWNCTGSIPWLKALEQRLAGSAFRIVGIHSPEFAHERDASAVAAEVRKLGLHHAIMLDNDLAYWAALENRYWPAFHLVDRRGHLRAVYIGETHDGDAQAQRIEENIRALLVEPAADTAPLTLSSPYRQ